MSVVYDVNLPLSPLEVDALYNSAILQNALNNNQTLHLTENWFTEKLILRDFNRLTSDVPLTGWERLEPPTFPFGNVFGPGVTLPSPSVSMASDCLIEFDGPREKTLHNVSLNANSWDSTVARRGVIKAPNGSQDGNGTVVQGCRITGGNGYAILYRDQSPMRLLNNTIMGGVHLNRCKDLKVVGNSIGHNSLPGGFGPAFTMYDCVSFLVQENYIFQNHENTATFLYDPAGKYPESQPFWDPVLERYYYWSSTGWFGNIALTSPTTPPDVSRLTTGPETTSAYIDCLNGTVANNRSAGSTGSAVQVLNSDRVEFSHIESWRYKGPIGFYINPGSKNIGVSNSQLGDHSPASLTDTLDAIVKSEGTNIRLIENDYETVRDVIKSVEHDPAETRLVGLVPGEIKSSYQEVTNVTALDRANVTIGSDVSGLQPDYLYKYHLDMVFDNAVKSENGTIFVKVFHSIRDDGLGGTLFEIEERLICVTPKTTTRDITYQMDGYIKPVADGDFRITIFMELDSGNTAVINTAKVVVTQA